MADTFPNEGEWLAARLGTRNWVVARRTARLVERYGDDVVCLSQERISSLRETYHEERRETLIGQLANEYGVAVDVLREAFELGRRYA